MATPGSKTAPHGLKKWEWPSRMFWLCVLQGTTLRPSVGRKPKSAEQHTFYHLSLKGSTFDGNFFQSLIDYLSSCQICGLISWWHLETQPVGLSYELRISARSEELWPEEILPELWGMIDQNLLHRIKLYQRITRQGSYDNGLGDQSLWRT